MAGTPFKMKGFSGFGNSPLRDEKKKVKMLEGTTIFGKKPKKYVETAKKIGKGYAREMKSLFTDLVYPGTAWKAEAERRRKRK